MRQRHGGEVEEGLEKEDGGIGKGVVKVRNKLVGLVMMFGFIFPFFFWDLMVFDFLNEEGSEEVALVK